MTPDPMTPETGNRNGAATTGGTMTGTTTTGPAGREPSLAELLARIEAVEAELAALRASVAGRVREGPVAGNAPEGPVAGDIPDGPVAGDIPEEVVIAISAAVAAYLGKRARVRQIHLAGDTAWAREGRAYVQSVHSASRRR